MPYETGRWVTYDDHAALLAGVEDLQKAFRDAFERIASQCASELELRNAGEWADARTCTIGDIAWTALALLDVQSKESTEKDITSSGKGE